MIARHLTLDSPPSIEAALFVDEGSVGAHVGVIYRGGDGSMRLLHQAWHCDSRDEGLAEYLESPGTLLWVTPDMNEDEQADLRTHSALVARRISEKSIPYAFRAKNASISAEGNVNLGESLGLTCATFVIRLFDAARVRLILEASWETGGSPERKEEDKAAQKKLVQFLADSHKPEHRKHARLVESEIESPRIRAEEVAAASGLSGRPISYEKAERAGRKLLAEIHNVKAASMAAKVATEAEKTDATLAESGYEAARAMGAAPKAQQG